MAKITIDVPEEYEVKIVKKILHDSEDKSFEYVDLSLPSGTLWATCNVGASEPARYGDYLNWDNAQKYNCPSIEQLKELRDNCIWKWITINTIKGYLVIGKNANSIFLPAAGYRSSSNFIDTGQHGCYWSSKPSGEYHADYMFFNSNSVDYSISSYIHGKSIRPIKNKE